MTDAAGSIYDGPTEEPSTVAKAAERIRTIGRKTAPADSGGRKAPADPHAKPAAKKRHPRVSLTPLLGRFAEDGGRALVDRGDPPLGRVLLLEARPLSIEGEKALKGTLADRALQPLARLEARSAAFVDLVDLQVATEMFRRRPSFPTRMHFVTALSRCLPQIVEGAKEAVQRQNKLEAELAELGPLFGVPAGETVTLEHVARWIFAAPEAETPPAPGT